MRVLCFQGALKGTRSGLEEGRVCRVLAEGGGWVIHHCRVVGQAARELGCICVWRLSLENRGAGGNRPWRGGSTLEAEGSGAGWEGGGEGHDSSFSPGPVGRHPGVIATAECEL